MANTTLAGATAGVATLFVNLLAVRRRTGKTSFDLILTMNGSLCGLASITGGCAGKDLNRQPNRHESHCKKFAPFSLPYVVSHCLHFLL